MSHQASRAEHQGTEAPVAVPRDTDAKRLVEAIRDNVTFKPEEAAYQLQSRLLIAQDNASRLAVLLDERDAEREALGLMLAKTLGALEGTRAGIPNWDLPSLDAVITEANDFLPRVKGDS